MPDSKNNPFRQFVRAALLSMVALVALAGVEWWWVRSQALAIAHIPERIELVARERLMAMRLTTSAIGYMQAPTDADRVPYAREHAAAREALRALMAQIRADRIGWGGLPIEDPRSALVRHRFDSLLTTAATLMQQRQDSVRGPLRDREVRTLIVRTDSVIAAIERVLAAEKQFADDGTTQLQYDQTLVFSLMAVVLLVLGLAVLRPAAMRMGSMAKRLHAVNMVLQEQQEALAGNADELEAQYTELQEQQSVMERHRALLEELQHAAAVREARHRSVLEAMAEGMLLVRADGVLLAWNGSAARLLGVDAAELKRHAPDAPAFSILSEDGTPLADHDTPVGLTLATGAAVNDEIVRVALADGTQRWLRVSSRPVHMDDVVGETQRTAVLTFSDISAERTLSEQVKQLSLAVTQSRQPVAMSDARLRLTWVNPAWSAVTGYTLEEAIGRRPAELLHGPHTAADTIERMRAGIKSGEGFDGEVLNYRKDGTPFWMEVHTTALRDAHGTVTSWVSVQRDVTGRRAQERERQQLAAALAVTTDGIAIVSVAGGLEFVNHAFARSHGERPRNLIGHAWMQQFPVDEALRLEREAIPQVTRLGAWQGEATGRRQDGTLFPQDLSITLLPTGGLVCVMRDASERKQAEETLRTLALRDDLTQLYNRRGFFTQATDRLADLRRRHGAAVLLYADADAFKQVNDTWGHDVGDRVLQVIASVLRDSLRSSDVVARLGGDEFTALLVDSNEETSRPVLQRIEQALRDVDASGILPCPVALTIGIAHFDPTSGDDLDALMRAADGALYDRKRSRRARAA